MLSLYAEDPGAAASTELAMALRMLQRGTRVAEAQMEPPPPPPPPPPRPPPPPAGAPAAGAPPSPEARPAEAAARPPPPARGAAPPAAAAPAVAAARSALRVLEAERVSLLGQEAAGEARQLAASVAAATAQAEAWVSAARQRGAAAAAAAPPAAPAPAPAPAPRPPTAAAAPTVEEAAGAAAGAAAARSAARVAASTQRASAASAAAARRDAAATQRAAAVAAEEAAASEAAAGAALCCALAEEWALVEALASAARAHAPPPHEKDFWAAAWAAATAGPDAGLEASLAGAARGCGADHALRWAVAPDPPVPGAPARVLYRPGGGPLGAAHSGGRPLFLRVGSDGWRDPLSLPLSPSPTRPGWVEAAVLFPLGRVTVDAAATDGRGAWDNAGGGDFHAAATGARQRAATLAAAGAMEQLDAWRTARAEAQRAEEARAALRAQLAKDAAAKAAEASARLAARTLRTLPPAPAAGADLQLLYCPAGGPLQGRPQLWARGGYNRWRGDPRRWGPVRLEAVAEPAGWFGVSLSPPPDVWSLDCVFSDGGGDIAAAWDNRGGNDFHVPLAGGATREGVPLAEPPLHIIHVAAEMAPIAKVGGLGDVVTALGRAVAAAGHRVEVRLSPEKGLLAHAVLANTPLPVPFLTRCETKTHRSFYPAMILSTAQPWGACRSWRGLTGVAPTPACLRPPWRGCR